MTESPWDFADRFFDVVAADGAVAGDVVGFVLDGELEDFRDGFLDIVNGDKVDFVGCSGLDAEGGCERSLRVDAFLGAGDAFDLTEEFEKSVERERFADNAVGASADHDGGAVDGVGESGFADEFFRVEFAAFIGVVEVGCGHGVFHDASDGFSCDVSGADVMESGDFDRFGEGESRLSSAEVGRIGFSLKVFAEVHIGRAMEEGVEWAFLRHGFRREVSESAFHNGHAAENVVCRFRFAVELALLAQDFFRAGLSGFTAETAAEGHHFVVGMFTQ